MIIGNKIIVFILNFNKQNKSEIIIILIINSNDQVIISIGITGKICVYNIVLDIMLVSHLRHEKL